MPKMYQKPYRWIKLVKLTRNHVLVAGNAQGILSNEYLIVDPDLVEIMWDSGGCPDPGRLLDHTFGLRLYLVNAVSY